MPLKNHTNKGLCNSLNIFVNPALKTVFSQKVISDEAKFRYFLMKGMGGEGEANANQDNEITAGELHSYVQTNITQRSSGSQTPELQGDADRALVQFQ